MTPADLRQMIEAATPGPWYGELPGKYPRIRSEPTNSLISCPPEGFRRIEDVEAICALRNKAPAILALWEAAQDLDRRMKLGGDEDADGIKALRAALAAMGKE